MKTFDAEFLQKLERLTLPGTKLIQGGTGGRRRSKAKGSSIEFSDFREYTPGDDYRAIDWHAYARFERLFIKLFMEEREANITIFLDTSASMDYGQPSKGVLAKKLAAVFAYIALANYDRVGIAALNDGISDRYPYFSGKPGFFKALEFIDRLPFSGRTSLNKSQRQDKPEQEHCRFYSAQRTQGNQHNLVGFFCKRRVQGSIQVFNVRTAGYNSGANPCAGRTEPPILRLSAPDR